MPSLYETSEAPVCFNQNGKQRQRVPSPNNLTSENGFNSNQRDSDSFVFQEKLLARGELTHRGDKRTRDARQGAALGAEFVCFNVTAATSRFSPLFPQRIFSGRSCVRSHAYFLSSRSIAGTTQLFLSLSIRVCPWAKVPPLMRRHGGLICEFIASGGHQFAPSSIFNFFPRPEKKRDQGEPMFCHLRRQLPLCLSAGLRTWAHITSTTGHGLDCQAGLDWRDTHPPQLQHGGLQAWSRGGWVGVWERRLPRSGLAFLTQQVIGREQPLLTSLCIHNSSQEGEVSPLEEEMWLIVVSPTRRFLARRPRRHNTVFPTHQQYCESLRRRIYCSVCVLDGERHAERHAERQTQARSWC